MTDTATIAPEIEERPAPRETLWVTDAELIRRIGAPEKVAREAIHRLDADRSSGFPQKQSLWGDRRYWPAVRAYLDERYGLRIAHPQQRRDGHVR